MIGANGGKIIVVAVVAGREPYRNTLCNYNACDCPCKQHMFGLPPSMAQVDATLRGNNDNNTT